MVKTTSTRKTTDAAPEVTTEVDLEIKTEDASDVDQQFFGRWFPIACECGTTVISDDEAERGTTIKHAAHLVRLGQATPPATSSFVAEGKEIPELVVTPKDGRVSLTVEQFEKLAAGAGLTKVDPVA